MLAVSETQTLPALVQRAASQLASATSAAEVLQAHDTAGVEYTVAKAAARLAKAKGAHDELIAKCHRAQADALEIEAAAKRRLADEYDAAQERGEVRKAGGDQTSEREECSANDLGLTHKFIHEARQIRDAEEASPGVVRRVLDDALSAGEEPTKAAVRRAVVTTNNGESMVATQEAEAPKTRNVGTKIAVPDNADILSLCRKGIDLEASGMTSDAAANELGLARNSYRTSRLIVMLADRPELSEPDKAAAAEALAILTTDLQCGRAWDVAESVANKVWGARRLDRVHGLAERRVEQFERTFGIIIQSCLTAEEVELPYLSAEQAKQCVRQITEARRALAAFSARIREMHQ